MGRARFAGLFVIALLWASLWAASAHAAVYLDGWVDGKAQTIAPGGVLDDPAPQHLDLESLTTVHANASLSATGTTAITHANTA